MNSYYRLLINWHLTLNFSGIRHFCDNYFMIKPAIFQIPGYNYLSALESAFIIDRIPRYDLMGKEILKTFEKYFTGDQAIIYSIMGYKDRMISGVLENIVMLEMKRRGFRVFTGKWGKKEVDFVAEKNENKIYVQVAYKMVEQSTIDREFSPLILIKDNHPKFVVTMEQFWKDNIEGVKHIHIVDFLLMESWV